jgi:glutathione S-transferase
MLQVYAFATPNSLRIPIALEELGLDYELNAVNVRKGEQKQPGYLAINPNGKVPVLVDPEGPDGETLILTESGAILVYLAEKTGKLLPKSGAARARVFEQMFFHLTGIGPAFGQVGFFKRQASENLPLAIERFQKEAERVLAVLDEVLAVNRRRKLGQDRRPKVGHLFGCIEASGESLDGLHRPGMAAGGPQGAERSNPGRRPPRSGAEPRAGGAEHGERG